MQPSQRNRLLGTWAAMCVLVGGLRLSARIHVPNINRLPPQELLEETKEVLPNGFVLRDLFRRGVQFTESSEGWYPLLYNDAAHYCTIGYGHLIKKAPCDGTEPREFKKALTRAEGEKLLYADLVTSRYAVMTTVRVSMSDGQFAALTDFVFNAGASNFRKSTLLKVLNGGEEDRVPAQLRRWVFAGGKRFKGLVDRREGEIRLFFEGRPIPKGVPVPGEDLSPIDLQTGQPLGGSETSREISSLHLWSDPSPFTLQCVR